jgi:hypothetical protein
VSYQGLDYEIDLKYGDRDISGGSSVFSRSKDGRVGDGPLPSKSTNHYFDMFYQLKLIKEKVSVSH